MKRLLFTLLLLGASLQARPPETIPNDTPEGLLLCGYQGWFNTPGDGSGRGWRHYRGTDGRFDADSAGIDCWPDMSEASPQERYETPLRKPDGSPAFVFSSRNSATVDRHFRWMREYGISGVFFQRLFQTGIGMSRGSQPGRRTQQQAEQCFAGAVRDAQQQADGYKKCRKRHKKFRLRQKSAY